MTDFKIKLNKDRVNCIIRELNELIDRNDSLKEVELVFSGNELYLTPLCDYIKIVLSKEN